MELGYHLIRSRKRKKTLTLKVSESGTVIIQAPCHVPVQEIQAFFERKKAWIHERIRRIQAAPLANPHGPLVAGERFFFLGGAYPLVIEDSGRDMDLFALKDQRFILNRHVLHHGRSLMRAWYEKQAQTYLPGRVDHYCRIWGLSARGIRISNAVHRWGSCSPENTLSFAWRLMMAPADVIDYVVVHEAAHIREKNHARGFWALVSQMMPDYDLRRGWLRKHSHMLHF